MQKKQYQRYPDDWTQINLILPKELKEKLQKVSAEQYTSASNLVRAILMREFKGVKC